MTRRRNSSLHSKHLYQVVSAVAGTGIDVSDYEYLTVEIDAAAGSTNFDAAFKGSLAETSPDFHAAASSTNPYFKLARTEATTNTTTSGATDITIAAAGVVAYTINTRALKWFAVDLPSWTSGTVTVRVLMA